MAKQRVPSQDCQRTEKQRKDGRMACNNASVTVWQDLVNWSVPCLSMSQVREPKTTWCVLVWSGSVSVILFHKLKACLTAVLSDQLPFYLQLNSLDVPWAHRNCFCFHQLTQSQASTLPSTQLSCEFFQTRFNKSRNLKSSDHLWKSIGTSLSFYQPLTFPYNHLNEV